MSIKQLFCIHSWELVKNLSKQFTVKCKKCQKTKTERKSKTPITKYFK